MQIRLVIYLETEEPIDRGFLNTMADRMEKGSDVCVLETYAYDMDGNELVNKS